MKYGDISNQCSPILAICIDDILYREEKRTGILSRFLPTKRVLNQEFIYRINWLWAKTNFAIYLVSFALSEAELIDELTGTGLPINYTRAVSYLDGGVELARKDIDYSFSFYVDDDETRCKFFGPRAYRYKELENVSGMNGRRFY